MEKILDVSDLALSFDDKVLIDDLSFSIEENSLNAFLCPNNSGKTTLIKTLSGLMWADSGKIVVNGTTLSMNSYNEYILSISTILDDINDQFLCSKVYDEIKYPLMNLSYDELDINSIVESVADTLKISTILGKDISRLKYYEKVKTLVAASIVHNPKVLFVDDIFRFLTAKEKKDLFKIFKSIINKYGIAIVFTTSDINDVIDVDNIYVYTSKIVMSGSYSEIIKKDNELSKLGFSIPIMIDLSRKLEFYNLVDTIYYDMDELVNALWK